MLRLLLASISIASLPLLACGGDDDPTGPGVEGEDVLYDDAFTGSCDSLTCRDSEVKTACTCVDAPLTDAMFATNQVGCDQLPTEMGRPRTPEDDYCDAAGGDDGPAIDCMMPGMYDPAGTPMMITVYGVVDVFGNGGDANAITVEVYREGADGQLGELVGSATSSIDSACSEEEDEIDNDMVIGTRQLGFYSIPNVPTETPLIVKTSGNAEFWKDLYTYNFYVFNHEVEASGAAGDPCADAPAGPRFEYRGRTLSVSDYNSIPLTAGVPGGITAGNGAVAGEVHDCNDVRLEYAQVGVSPRAETLVYFNDNPSNPLPQMGRAEGTSMLGLYSALNIAAGPVDVSAAGRVGDDAVSLGWYRVRVFEGAVTAVTLRGLRPHQVE